MRRKLMAALDERGLLAPVDAEPAGVADIRLTVYGQPAWRAVPAGHEAQALMAGTARQRDLVASAYATPAMGADLCAAWVERAFERLSLGVVTGDAAKLYAAWCRHADTRELKVGMIVAVPAHPYTIGGQRMGHVGLYVGDNLVMHCADGRVQQVPLELWLSTYGVSAEPRWSWLGGIALD